MSGLVPPFSTKIFKYRKTAKEREGKGGTSLGTLTFWAGPVEILQHDFVLRTFRGGTSEIKHPVCTKCLLPAKLGFIYGGNGALQRGIT